MTLTATAREVLLARGEQLRIFGYYFGGARPGARTEMGEVDLGGNFDLSGLPLQGPTLVPSKPLNAVALRQISDGPQLLINVVSARTTSPDNLLSCDVYEGPIATASLRMVTLHCGLIAEGLPTQMVRSFAASTPAKPATR